MPWLVGMHVIFLRQVTCKKATRKRDGFWRLVTAEAVLKRAGTQSLKTYVDRREATLEDWVALRTIFDVSTQETGYEGGGRLRVIWWRQESEENQLRVTVEAISALTRGLRRKESVRHRGRKGGLDG